MIHLECTSVAVQQCSGGSSEPLAGSSTDSTGPGTALDTVYLNDVLAHFHLGEFHIYHYFHHYTDQTFILV